MTIGSTYLRPEGAEGSGASSPNHEWNRCGRVQVRVKKDSAESAGQQVGNSFERRSSRAERKGSGGLSVELSSAALLSGSPQRLSSP